MTHPAIPNDQNPPNDDLETQPSSPDSENQPAPNTSSPTASVTDTENVTRYNALLEDNLRDQNRRIQELQDQLARTTTPPAAPASASRTEEEERQDFYNRPVATTRLMIQEELDRTIKPLTDFVQQMRGGTESEKILNRLKGDPRFAPHWDMAVEQAVNGVIARLSPDQINEQTIMSTIIQAIGLKSIGQLAPVPGSPVPAPAPTPQPSTQPQNGNPPVTTPPHMRPSSPPGPNANQPPRRRQLNENEKRLAREKRMSDDTYLDWLEMPASQIAKAPIPGAPKGDNK
ncbi:MAG: hypothetical protein H0U60_12700 [Blastocatellia bacterium]|nr:hypothetical protein [Blastocatellia bacterium]